MTILDNDSQPSLAVNDVAQAEGNAQNQMTFNITLSAPSTQTVTVNYSTSNGTAIAGQDYVATANQVTFNPGETSKQVAITILGDFVIEPDESFFIDLSGAVNAPIFDAQGVGTMVNDDGAGTIQFDSAAYTVNEVDTVGNDNGRSDRRTCGGRLGTIFHDRRDRDIRIWISTAFREH